MQATIVQFSLSVVLLVTVGASSYARTLFQTSFDEPQLHSGLEDVDGAFEPPSGVIRRNVPPHDEDRHYLRTTDSDYFATGPFSFEVSFTNPEGFLGTLQYIGLGQGVPNPNYYNEPGPPTGTAGTGTGSVYLRIHSPDLVGGRIDWAFNYGVPGEDILAEAIGYIQTIGTHRARIRATADQLEMSIDEDFTGVFTPTISSTIDLNAYPQIKAVLMSESRAFFGTARSSVEYDSFAIVPEPTTGLTMMFSLVVFGTWRTSRRSSAVRPKPSRW